MRGLTSRVSFATLPRVLSYPDYFHGMSEA
jgi:hypothetical protein